LRAHHSPTVQGKYRITVSCTTADEQTAMDSTIIRLPRRPGCGD
jgi:hypothetical protein